MPYTTPTVEEFRTRFPIFGDASDELVQMMLNEAAGQVDQSWEETDYQPAILYLAAHLLATDNSAEGGTVEVGASGAGNVTSESFGAISVGYGAGNNQGSLSSSDLYGSTVYGRRFLALLKQNKPAIVAVL